MPATDAIDAAVSAYAMLKHPLHRAWADGSISLAALQTYAKQYFHHVETFPRVVSAAHTQCPSASGRRMLAENLMEEEGLGPGKVDHASLWLDFARGLGVTAAAVHAAAPLPETKALIDTFEMLSRRSFPAALGALYAFESQMPAVSAMQIAGLVGHGVTDGRSIRFFAVHESADVDHASVCRGLLNEMSDADAAEARDAAQSLARALWTFLDGVMRALEE